MKIRTKWTLIFVLVVILLYLAFHFFFRHYLIINNINKNIDIEGLELLDSENDVISNLGSGENIPHLGFGKVIYYDSKMLKVGIIDDKVNSLNTTNSKHSIYDIHVGISFIDAERILMSNGFKPLNSNSFKKGRFILLLGTEDENITRIHIWYEDPKLKNKTA